MAAGVYVTAAGLFVCAVLLNVPPPDVMDQVPVEAPPPTLAPLSVTAVGVADWQISADVPAVTVGAGFTFIVLVALTAPHAPGASVVNFNVTIPLKLAAGV